MDLLGHVGQVEVDGEGAHQEDGVGHVGVDEKIVALGANRLQLLWLLVREARLGLLAALMAGFGAVISEVGASMMVGGNIAGETRVLTTATVLETSRGNIEIGIALGVMLLVLAYVVNLVMTGVQQQRRAL